MKRIFREILLNCYTEQNFPVLVQDKVCKQVYSFFPLKNDMFLIQSKSRRYILQYISQHNKNLNVSQMSWEKKC